MKIAIVILLAALLTSCGTARRGVPYLGPMELTDPTLVHGQRAFMQSCNQCHPRGEAGIGPAINNKWLPGWLIRAQVRFGFGAMPAFTEEELSDSDVRAIVAYLQYLRNRGPY